MPGATARMVIAIDADFAHVDAKWFLDGMAA